MLDPKTGQEFKTWNYEILYNIGMPVLTKQSQVFAVNQTHVSVVDPFINQSYIEPLPESFPHGILRSKVTHI